MDNNKTEMDVEMKSYLAGRILQHDIQAQLVNEKHDEIDLSELVSAIWSGKLVIIIITFCFAVASVVFALSQPNIYKSSVLLSPASAEGGSSLSGLAGQFGGLASLAGINLGSNGGDKTTLAIETLKSRKFLQAFIERHQLLVPVMAAKGWDLGTNQLIIDSDIYNVVNEQWVREVSLPKKAKPSLWEAYKDFSNLISVSQDKESGMVIISVEYYSPFLAKQWTDWLVKELNATIKLQDQKEAEDSINYLEQQLAKTNVANMQAVFYQLIEEQSKNMMLTQIKDEYVLKTIDPAQVAEEKVKPKRALIVVLGTMLGAIFSIVVVVFRYFTGGKSNKVRLSKSSVSKTEAN